MSIATQPSSPIPEPHDAPRATVAAPRITEPEVTSDPEPLDDALDNPYDNIACTD
ncbi:MAG TPA: hypothetical protein VGL81_00410 [Polyangiaceae bacterium]|jgi:hypothetical protein